MDPIKMLLEYLQTNFADKLPGDAVAAIESTARELFARFELVPKHEFEAQTQILASLEQQADFELAVLMHLDQAVSAHPDATMPPMFPPPIKAILVRMGDSPLG